MNFYLTQSFCNCNYGWNIKINKVGGKNGQQLRVKEKQADSGGVGLESVDRGQPVLLSSFQGFIPGYAEGTNLEGKETTFLLN